MNTEQLKAALHTKKVELASRAERTHRHIYLKEEPVSPNFNEQVKQTENDALVAALDQEGQSEIARIDRALQRIAEGSYEFCNHCGCEIGDERLRALPDTDCCICCAELV